MQKRFADSAVRGSGRAQRAEHDARRQKLEHLIEMLGAG
jgi:hypothetical protein